MLTTLMTVALLLDPPVADAEPRWWKGNTHTHTYWSDGDAAPEHVVDWYVRHGYNFVVLSEHNIMATIEKWHPIGRDDRRPLTQAHVDELEERFGPGWVELKAEGGELHMRLKTLDELKAHFDAADSFVLIPGEEVTDRFRRHEIHINAINTDEVVGPQRGTSVVETIQNNIDAIIEAGRRAGRPVMAHVNHPNYAHSLTPQDIAAIRGERFFEVYNGHRGVLNHGDEGMVSTERLWDIAQTLRLTEFDLGVLYALAVDDAHDHHGTKEVSTPGRGWVMVRAPKLGRDEMIVAMRAGEFYSSCGVTLETVSRTETGIALEIQGEEGLTYRTEFIGTRMADGEPVEVGAILATSDELSPKFEFAGDELYVRARVVSSRLHPNPFAEGDYEMAWVQPVLGPASKERSATTSSRSR